MRTLQILTACLIPLTATGCAAMYDARREANTTAVSQAYKSADPGAYFEELRASYREVGARQEDAQLAIRRAERDDEVIGAVAPGSLTPSTGTASFRLRVAAALQALRDDCSAGCSIPSEADLNRWRDIGIQRTMLVRVAPGRSNASLTEFAASDGTIGEVLQQIKLGETQSADVAVKSSRLEADIAALDEKAKRQPKAELLEEVVSLQKELSGVNLPELARVAGLKKVASLLDDLLAVELGSAVADAGGAPVADAPSATTRRAQAMLQLAGAAEGVVLAYAKFPAVDRASALLIARAAVQQKLDVASLDAKLKSDLLRVNRAKLDALTVELAGLAEAELALRGARNDSSKGVVGLKGGDRAKFVRALVQYGIATSKGGMVVERFDMRAFQLQRTYRVDLNERTALNRRALIAPAIAQIEAAGKAGVRPELIATLAGQLGVASSVLAN